MSELSCSCCGVEERRDAGESEPVEIATVSVEEAREAYRSRPIPDALADRLQTAHELEDAPATVGDWADGVRDAMADRLDGSPAVADLCLAGTARHRAAWDGGTEQFHCTVDAMMVPFVVDEPVTVTSASPRDGTLVTVAVDGDEATVQPGDAVLSLGADAVEEGDGFEWNAAIEGLCAYGNAFPSRAAYEDWASGVDAETTAIPLAEGVGLAADLVG